jgi:hypothetical protein
VRYRALAMPPPHHHLKRGQLKPLSLWAILVQEEAPSAGVTPIVWLLWTSLPITDLDAALRCVRWYSYRWLIERYHFVLKSGCRLEDLQLAEAARLERALATYCIVAWRLLWLTYEARQNPDTPCDRVLERSEWQALYCRIHKTSRPPATPPTLRQAVRWIAQLGGFLGRKADGEPGVQTIWLGLHHNLRVMMRRLGVGSRSTPELCSDSWSRDPFQGAPPVIRKRMLASLIFICSAIFLGRIRLSSSFSFQYLLL